MPEPPPAVVDGVAVVVVSHWSGALLADCVARALSAQGVAELVVVDNASGDGSVEELQRRFRGDSRFTLLRNSSNAGFSVACNQGAARTASPWVAFLNPDCLVEAHTFVRLRRVAREHRSAGLIGADVRDDSGMPEPAARRREPTVARAVAHVLGRAGGDSLHLQAPQLRSGVTEVDAISGALMFVPRPAWERVGGFDPRYRLHCEDLDLCRRMREAGFRVLVAEDVSVVHRKGSSSQRRPLFVAFHKHRGMSRYLAKFEGRRAPLRALAARAAVWLRFGAILPLLLARDLRARLR